jgi:3-oxoacyl-[acyl-carrier protein] reductase
MTRASSSAAGGHAGRMAVVFGAAAGLGGALARRLRDVGARVALLDPDPPEEPELQDGAIDLLAVDPSREAEVEGAIDGIVSRHGGVDDLVCCPPQLSLRPFLDLTVADWRRSLAPLTGVFLACRAVLRPMQVRGSGRIVLVSSLAARTGLVDGGHVAAAAGGVLGFARSLAREVAADGIRVNTLSPAVGPDLQGGTGGRTPLGRGLRVDDVVEGALFLLGEEGSYLVGQDLRVTGGVGLW